MWPQVGQYGNSKCEKPKDDTAPTKLASCYKSSDSADSKQLTFENHEWSAHGSCSGAANADDFFGQICTLSQAPLKVMATGTDLETATKALVAAGYPLVNTDPTNAQVEIGVCAGADGKWVIAAPKDFPSKCGGSAPHPSPSPPSPTPPSPSPPSPSPPSPSPPSPSPPSPSPAGTCVPGQHGPKCSSDGDCQKGGCKRCASSGFCTDQPKENEAAVLV